MECPDCGAPVTEKVSGVPAMTAQFDANGDYHDKSSCIRFLKGRIDALSRWVAALIKS